MVLLALHWRVADEVWELQLVVAVGDLAVRKTRRKTGRKTRDVLFSSVCSQGHHCGDLHGGSVAARLDVCSTQSCYRDTMLVIASVI